MIKIFTFVLTATILLCLSLTPQAQAANCSKLASKVAKETGGEVLNVAVNESGSCDITIRIPGKNGEPPRVVTHTVSG